MRFVVLSFIIVLVLFTYELEPKASPESNQMNDKTSVIVEVEGDPETHKAYIELHHPYIEVIAIYDTLLNGLALQAKTKYLVKVSTLDFVKAMFPVQLYKANTTPLKTRSTNTTFPNDLNTTNFTGKGVKVGVIDTGIDYNHPDLMINYVGGYDLVDLDDDPLETIPSQGVPTLHGTHVAGIIAADGKLKGVAPDAEIYAYRALGPGGSGTSVQVIAAMEKAIKDDVDIMNLSLGNDVNGPDYPTSIAVNKAVDLGKAVVIANGNSGPNNWTVGSPATASKALSVGATVGPQEKPYLYDSLTRKKIMFMMMHESLQWELKKDYEIVNVSDKNANLRGKIALIQRSNDITFYELANEAADKGAVAVLIYNNEAGSFQGSIQHEKSPISIPVANITEKDGKWLVKQMKEKSFFMDTAYESTQIGIAPFSSRGPVTVNWEIKPDVLAPGTNIISTVPGGYEELQGTSMAAPHVAGAIALLKEAHPNWTNTQISGALKTTALKINRDDNQTFDPIIQGMGQVQIQAAIDTETIIHHPLLSFGKVEKYKETKEAAIMIENTTNETQTYSFHMPKSERGLNWDIPLEFTLQKADKRTIPIKLHIVTSQINEGIHQGWLTLNRNKDNKTYELPYVFINKTADYPKAMGFEFSLELFSDDMYVYRFYVPDTIKDMQVNLYNPDTLVYEHSLFKLTDVKKGMNEGKIKRAEIGKAGYYKALIYVQLESGEINMFEEDVFIEE